MHAFICDKETLVKLGFNVASGFTILKTKRLDGVSVQAEITANSWIEVSINSTFHAMKGYIAYSKPLKSTSKADIEAALQKAVDSITRLYSEPIARAAERLLV